MLSTVGRCRKEHYFGPENDFTITVEDDKDATRLLSSSIHKFMVVPDKEKLTENQKAWKDAEKAPVVKPEVKPEPKSEIPKAKKKGKKHEKKESN